MDIFRAFVQVSAMVTAAVILIACLFGWVRAHWKPRRIQRDAASRPTARSTTA